MKKETHSHSQHLWGRTMWVIVVAVMLVTASVESTLAQMGASGWTDPLLIFEGDGEIYTPLILTDIYGRVHVFWQYSDQTINPADSSISQIYYTQWDGNAWSPPVDIFVGFLNSFSAATDNNGVLHLAWLGQGMNYYYSHSWVNKSTSARSWSKPKILAQGNPAGSLYTDHKGRLYFCYPGTATSGIYLIYSDDRGYTWSSPRNVVKAQGNNSSAAYTFLIRSENGTIHIVWTEFQLPTSWPPTGVYYIRSTDNGNSWSPAIKVAGEGYDQINIAAGKNGIVYVVWNGMVGVGGRYHSWSYDDGNSWSTPLKITEDGATNGPPQLIVDDTGVLHMLTASIEAWYLYWQDGKWSAPQPLSAEVNTGFVEEPSMATNLGNQLHAVFWVNRKSLWYTWLTIPASSLPTQAFHTETPTSNSFENAPTFIPATLQPTMQYDNYSMNQDVRILTPGYFIFLGAIPPVGLILALLLLKFFRK